MAKSKSDAVIQISLPLLELVVADFKGRKKKERREEKGGRGGEKLPHNKFLPTALDAVINL